MVYRNHVEKIWRLPSGPVVEVEPQVKDAFWLALLLKMSISAAVVIVVSIIVERARPILGAMIMTLPIASGPNFAYLAFEHGPSFLQASALAGLPANAATALFIIIYATLAQRAGLAFSLGAAAVGWGTGVFLLSHSVWTLTGALALNIVVYTGSILFGKRLAACKIQKSTRFEATDVAVRAGTVAILVAIVLVTGQLAGPGAAGFAALAPIVLTSLALILHRRIGGPGMAAVMIQRLPGLMGFAAALTVLYLAAEALGSAAALMLALVSSIVWNGSIVLMQWPRKRNPRRSC